MSGCILKIKPAIERCVVKRYLPIAYWLSSTKHTRFGAEEIELNDYAGRTFVLHGPPIASGLRRPNETRPFVIAPVNLLGAPGSWLFFGIKNDSEYTRYWHDYPLRRFVPPGKTDGTSDTPPSVRTEESRFNSRALARAEPSDFGERFSNGQEVSGLAHEVKSNEAEV
jgi:hypothetical protein